METLVVEIIGSSVDRMANLRWTSWAAS
jgi:hypothetical protein